MSGAPARPTDLRRFASIWNAAAPVGDTPGAAYLAGRGIDPHPSVRYLARSEWDAAGLQYDLAPTRASHGPDLGPGTEVAASHGYPARRCRRTGLRLDRPGRRPTRNRA